MLVGFGNFPSMFAVAYVCRWQPPALFSVARRLPCAQKRRQLPSRGPEGPGLEVSEGTGMLLVARTSEDLRPAKSRALAAACPASPATVRPNIDVPATSFWGHDYQKGAPVREGGV